MSWRIQTCLLILFNSAGLAWGQVSSGSSLGGDSHIATDPPLHMDAPQATGPSNHLPAEPILPAPPVNSDGRFYASAEYLLWWTKHSPLPPSLITTGPVADNPGSLGDGGVPLTRGSLDQGALSGFRIGLGFRLGDCLGVEGVGFVLPS
jgi:hypothetical protein